MRHKRVLLTGARGFLGRHVAAELDRAGAHVVGLGRDKVAAEGLGGWIRADLLSCDWTRLLEETAPDIVVNLAGEYGAPPDDAARARMVALNHDSPERLFEALARTGCGARVVLTASAAIYAPMAPAQDAIDERQAWRPLGSYGRSKAAMTLMAEIWRSRAGLDLVTAVPFNVIGPGQPCPLAPATFLARLRPGTDRLETGDLSAVRDWIDVRDTAAAIVRLADVSSSPGVYNVATGTGTKVATLLDRLLELGGFKVEVVQRAGPIGVSRSIGNAGKLRRETGWQPRIALDSSLEDMLTYSQSY